ncbi:hypothetical protein ACWEPB_19245 [Kitasatospora cineracea]
MIAGLATAVWCAAVGVPYAAALLGIVGAPLAVAAALAGAVRVGRRVRANEPSRPA